MKQRAFSHLKFKSTPGVFHIITYSIILILVLSSLVQHGMFMDGTQYACAARDLALEKGTFWFPHLSDSWFKNGSTAFMEHLPLAYFLQSKFFLVFGESIYTEKTYCFCCLLFSTLFIQMIWQLLPLENVALKRNSWLPLLLWITCGSVFWSYQNNMLEITVSVFVLASVYFMLRAIYKGGWKYLHILLSGLCIFLACLSKGLPGLFPLTGFMLFYFSCRKLSFKRALLYSAILVAVPFTIFALLYFFEAGARESLSFYVKARLFHRVNNDPLVGNRFTVLFWVITDMLAPLILAMLLTVLFKVKEVNNTLSAERRKLIAFFILLGLAGIVPLTLTLVQRAVYFIPALPFLAIGISLCLVNGIEELKKRFARYYQKIKYASFIFLAGVLTSCIFLAGKTSRDEEMIEDVRNICAKIPPGSNVDVTNYVYELWDFQFYLLRYGKITLWPFPNQNSAFYLAEKPFPAENIKNCQPLDIDLKNFELFKKPAKTR